MSTERDNLRNDAPKTPPSDNQTSGSEATRPPAGGAEKVGAAYNPGTVRADRNLPIAIIGLVVAIVLIVLVVIFMLSA